MSVSYEDPRITCDTDGITIRKYFFPFGDKRILYREIKGVEVHNMGTGIFTGRYRIWGGDIAHWFNYDPARPKKRTAFIIDKGDSVKAVVTPDDPDGFRSALEEHDIALR